jgi:lipoprotein-releasing system permease protein
MNSSVPLYIGLRYIRGKHQNGFLSFVSLLSFLAMSMGVAALIVVLSVMNGFDREIKQRLLNVVPHVSVTASGGIDDWQSYVRTLEQQPSIVKAAPFVAGYGMLSANNRNSGVAIQGVSPELEQQVTRVNDFMLAGSLQGLDSTRFGIVIGALLARNLDVFVGDTVTLAVPSLVATPAGVFPRHKRFQVVGIYRVDAQLDNGLAFIHYRDAQKLLRLGDKVHGVRAATHEPFQIDAEQLAKAFDGNVEVTRWFDTMRELFQAIKMEKAVVGTLLAAIIAVAAFNIIASLVLLVGEKRSDIAVLRSMGASSGAVAKIFMVQGAAIGLAGVFVGLAAGCLLALSIGDLLSWLEQQFGFQVFDPSVYFIHQLPSQLIWQDVAAVGLLAAVLSVLATLYPSFRAGKISPAEALRYDI